VTAGAARGDGAADGAAGAGAVRDVRLTDTTLRDGSHAMRHRWTAEQVRRVVRELDDAGVPVIEVAHGDGLGGSSFTYGFSATDEQDLVGAAVEEARHARIAVLLLPGVGTTEELHRAADRGATIARIATHCTEADVAIQHFGVARGLGMETVGFLMLSHMAAPAALAAQARIMVDAGAGCVYVVDSAGALVLDEAADRVRALVEELGDEAQVGFHGHNNLALGVADSVLAWRSGARQIDGALAALGAGSGNAPTEVLVAVFDRLGVATGVDLPRVLHAAQEVVRPLMVHEPVIDRDSIVMGHAGVYSSFLLHAERAARRYGVASHEVLAEVGRRGLVGGQEDLIVDVALQLAATATNGGS
jgi:4-hydroxy 2-oxovalerate aldolase